MLKNLFLKFKELFLFIVKQDFYIKFVWIIHTSLITAFISFFLAIFVWNFLDSYSFYSIFFVINRFLFIFVGYIIWYLYMKNKFEFFGIVYLEGFVDKVNSVDSNNFKEFLVEYYPLWYKKYIDLYSCYFFLNSIYCKSFIGCMALFPGFRHMNFQLSVIYVLYGFFFFLHWFIYFIGSLFIFIYYGFYKKKLSNWCVFVYIVHFLLYSLKCCISVYTHMIILCEVTVFDLCLYAWYPEYNIVPFSLGRAYIYFYIYIFLVLPFYMDVQEELNFFYEEDLKNKRN